MATFRELKRTKGRSVEARVYGPAGERISRTFQTKEAAKQWARKMEVDRDEGTFRDPRANKLTVSDVARSWFQSIDVEATTRVDYDSLWRTHVVSNRGTDNSTQSFRLR